MKNADQDPKFAAAQKHLAVLRAAETVARHDEAAALATLAQERPRETALAAAARLLRGESGVGIDDAAQTARLADARQRLRLFAAAVVEQEVAITAIRGALSAVANADAAPAHLKAAAGIVQALEALRAAMAAEEAVRENLAGAGYAVSLTPFARLELSECADALAADITLHLHAARLRAGPGVNVHILGDSPGLGLSGDVVKVDGPCAAVLVAAGRGEVTTAPPRRASRQEVAAEVVLS